MPLAFNWESAPFGLPALVGYLVPLRLAYIGRRLHGGRGRHRRLRVRPGAPPGGRGLGTFIGIAFVLAGRDSLVGWPSTSVQSWTGWLLAGASWWCTAGTAAGAVCMVGVSLALAVLAGQPDALVLLVAVAVFAGVVLAVRRVRPDRRRRSGAAWRDRPGRPAGVASCRRPSCCRGCSCWPVGSNLHRELRIGDGPRPCGPPLIFQGFDGLPVAGSHWFGFPTSSDGELRGIAGRGDGRGGARDAGGGDQR